MLVMLEKKVEMLFYKIYSFNQYMYVLTPHDAMGNDDDDDEDNDDDDDDVLTPF